MEKLLTPVEQEMEREEREQKRRRRAGWIGAGALTAALTGAGWYTYPALRQQSLLPVQMKDTRELVDGVGQRLAIAEERLRAWADDRDILRAQISDLEKKVRDGLGAARRQTAAVASSAGQQLQAEMEKRLEPLRARLAGVESAQDAGRERLLRVQAEVASLRRDLTQQIAELRDNTSRDVLEVHQRVDRHQGEISQLARLHDRQRVTFEVSKDRPSEVAPGIHLTIKRTNVARQTVDGWVQLVPDAKTLWVVKQKIQQPMIFYTLQDSRPHELVLSRVTGESVAGYLLVPRNAGAPAASGDGGQ